MLLDNRYCWSLGEHLMTKLEELIQELCPDGVEFRKVKEVYQRDKRHPHHRRKNERNRESAR